MTKPRQWGIIILAFAGVAHLVERDLAKVEVASSSLVARSKKTTFVYRTKVVFFVMRSMRNMMHTLCMMQASPVLLAFDAWENVLYHLSQRSCITCHLVANSPIRDIEQ